MNASTGGVAVYIDSLCPPEGIWIAGAGRAASDDGQLEVRDPATGRLVTRIADAGIPEAVAAVDAAAGALPQWGAATPPRVRSEVLRRAFELMMEERNLLAALIARENGKATADAQAEIAYAADFFRWFAEEAVRSEGAYGESPAGGTRTIVTHRPVGVAALVTPWNFPAAMATRKIAPALAAGCTVVLKPAAETPLTALAIARLLSRAGVPDGVVNVLPTSAPADVVSTWLEDPRVRKLSFTGSTGVGRVLLRQAADRVVNTSMELGGNAPFVVMDDADVDAAVQGALVAKFRNGGQACTAANRFYVHASVAERFVGRFVDEVAGLRVGPPEVEGNQIGPLITRRAVDDIRALVDSAVGAGARLAFEQQLDPGLTGYYFPPTVLTDVPDDADILQREIFGPVVTVVTWSDEEQVLAWVNGSEYGLAAYVYSGDLKRALRFSEALDAGMVGVNRGAVSDPAAPFGGMKQSGLGREGAREGMREFQEAQYFSVDWA
ncbi:NAD-dependent succinate-semialdehyde dehydrogenase [Blastococcus goldschmidtiae]|uniref:NAD-dependent succinate-semialdehyde dehydrogenase n=1 Tax=Blastococcus goldschmidtiae TaxID=3075546 RepID=A0ABU2K850_9ACTN|nr:NAD-dependent succinate-semialdehyde dehydrogenase [Blastococcus sp. DSM 46792]MDT0276365.1 NAD-dependent succinate-semialdehyde dehydrogenase [Blastococcus sp. DSM 46792]